MVQPCKREVILQFYISYHTFTLTAILRLNSCYVNICCLIIAAI